MHIQQVGVVSNCIILGSKLKGGNANIYDSNGQISEDEHFWPTLYVMPNFESGQLSLEILCN